ncbi:MAG: acyl transferase [Bacteroidota bacterium]
MKLREKIFKIETKDDFNNTALEIFRYQFEQNSIYRKFVQFFGANPETVKSCLDIPFLPVEFFKKEKIICGNAKPQAVFRSSGTSGAGESFHYVADLMVYKKSAVKAFKMFYGSPEDYTILALLPSYLEQKNSSLVWMTNFFISKSNFKNDCGFFIDKSITLCEKLKELVKIPQRKVLLLGVSYALLDFAEKIKFPLKNVIVMETGGMKGKGKEMVREELHKVLCDKLGVAEIHSEYGMTEMLSQAYSKGKGIFTCPHWMKVIVREMNDPLSWAVEGKTGEINVIDLANINSCSFIATQDIGRLANDGSFKVLGRFDNSDVRGCNLMIENG